MYNQIHEAAPSYNLNLTTKKDNLKIKSLKNNGNAKLDQKVNKITNRDDSRQSSNNAYSVQTCPLN
jgi:hypothetical protein